MQQAQPSSFNCVQRCIANALQACRNLLLPLKKNLKLQLNSLQSSKVAPTSSHPPPFSVVETLPCLFSQIQLLSICHIFHICIYSFTFLFTFSVSLLPLCFNATAKLSVRPYNICLYCPFVIISVPIRSV